METGGHLIPEEFQVQVQRGHYMHQVDKAVKALEVLNYKVVGQTLEEREAVLKALDLIVTAHAKFAQQ